MADKAGYTESQQRRLLTPDGSLCVRRSRTRSRSGVKSRLSEKEAELEETRKRLRLLEQEVHRNRQESARGYSRGHSQRFNTGSPSSGRREGRRRSPGRRESHRRSPHQRESRRRSPQQRESQRRGKSLRGGDDFATSYQRHRRERSRSAATKDKRSCTPTFSRKNVIDIFKSLKGNLESQPLLSGASNSKGVDHKNILPSFDPSTKGQRIAVWLR
ncbi:hypothetical protein ACJJTC_019848, partial [Scirpophaga incertulas]